MYKILKAEKLADKIFLMDVHAPRVASHCQPGQFVIVKMDDKGERIPLTICDYDREAGTITIVFQEVGASTIKMADLKEGDSFRDFVGPLGCPSEFVHEDLEELKKKKIVFVAGGVGAAPVYPQVKWLHAHGIEADVILGAKTKDMVILEKELEAVAGNLYVTTDDGSYGRSGMVTATLEDLVSKEGKTYDSCVAIGPMIMMKFVCLLTKKLEIPTIVSMNPIMVDGTGMCGACRLQVGDEIKFACVDGPEFDGHLVDFDQAMKRSRMYKTEEGRAILKLQEGMKAIITSDALDDQEINGEIIKVVKVYNASQPTTEQTGQETSGATNTGGFSVQIKLDPCDLISGMSAKAKIVLTDRENVLSVPYDLVQQDEDGKSYVLCAEENKDGTYTAVKKNITVGDEINYYTEVTGGDLKAGDYIIMDYAISEGDTFQGERGSDVSETEDGGSTSVSSEVTAD